jgi:hypothetical protein
LETDQSLICLFQMSLLLFQRRSKEVHLYFENQEKWKSCLGIICSLLNSQHVEIKILTIYSLKFILCYDRSGALLNFMEPMMNLMSSSDAITQIIIDIVAHMTLKYPDKLLKLLLKYLNSEQKDLKLNTILIIKTIIETKSNGLALHLSEVSQTLYLSLQDALLQCLHEEDLELRNQLSQVFLILDLNSIISELCQRISHDDLRVRSAVISSLLHLLDHHEDFLSCILNLFNYLRNQKSPSSFNLSTPSDIQMFSTEHNGPKMTRETDLIFTVLNKWCSTANKQKLEIFFSTLIEKCFDIPRDSILISLSSRVGVYLQEKELVISIFQKINSYIRIQFK